MHNEVREFLERTKQRFPEIFTVARVAEFGSFDINGSPREYFGAGEYVGIDWRPGPGVDLVSLAHEIQLPVGHFNTIVSTSMLEHDPHWSRTLATMTRLLAPGGSLVLSAAGEGWPVHEVETAPVEGYYGAVHARDLVPAVLGNARFRRTEVTDDPLLHDLFAVFYQKV